MFFRQALQMAGSASSVLSRDLRKRLPLVSHADGIYMYTQAGQKIIDACGGSAVACVGHGNGRVKEAVRKQMDRVPYCHSQFFTTATSEKLAAAVVDTAGGKLARLLTLSSGSEALEVALKVARQYFLELPAAQPRRVNYIARQPSYHGATLAALGLGGHLGRRAPFEPLFASSGVGKVSQCNVYRHARPAETQEAYAARLAKELDDEFAKFPPGTVCAFVAETVTGASTGTVPPARGYLAAVKQVCERHGALLILDEVMCGLGRTGTMHAWQQEEEEEEVEVVPNIQVVGKSFGGGYVPVSGVLIDHEVNAVLEAGSGKFPHGQSFQAHPSACAAALEVQNIIREEKLLDNVGDMGTRLADGLRERIGRHPAVGDIRGRGLFWSVEFVENKETRQPFAPDLNVGYSLQEFAMGEPYSLCLYPGKGTADGVAGDHVLLAPPYNVTSAEIDTIVDRLTAVVTDFFRDMANVGRRDIDRQW